jgi:hypothetical protein
MVNFKEIQDYINISEDVEELQVLRALCEENINKLNNIIYKRNKYVEIDFGNGHVFSKYNGAIAYIENIRGKLLDIVFKDKFRVSINDKRIKREVSNEEAKAEWGEEFDREV